MKIYAYILLLIFSSSVLKAGNIAHLGSQLVVSLFDLNSCESEEVSSCSHHENEDDKGCCGGNECHCTCCVHLVFIDSPNASRTIKRPILKEQSTYYQFNYDFDFNSGTFHPPLF